MKTGIIILILVLFVGIIIVPSFCQEVAQKKYAFEINLGPRIPIGITKDDITTGLAVNAGISYNILEYFELVRIGIDFGNSTPHDPNTMVIQDYYSYYGRLAMETVSIFGFPLTTRLHFPLKQYVEGFVGGGVAYYWFSSRLEDPIYGNLQKQRKRDGFGTILEAGLVTDFFSEKWLFTLTGNFSYLKTSGESLSIRENRDPELKEDRDDKYLTISVGVRYKF